ncbi:MAG: MliC family protein [Methylobacterium frigidaeris]
MWVRFSRLPLLAAGLISTAALAQPQRNSVAFTCAGGAHLTVDFAVGDPSQPAIVHPPSGAPVSLPPQPTGDGFRYGDGTRELRGRGDDVTWTSGTAPPLACTAGRKRPG